MSKKSTGPNWCSLPTELRHLIIQKLGIVDIIRIKAVSKSWCLAANSYDSSPLYSPFPQSPWLMLPPDQHHQNHSSFFNFAERKVYKLDNVLEGFDHDAWCAGSSHGWLIIFDQRGNSFIFNPFSRVTIQLPSVKFLHEQDREDEDYGHLLTSQKIRVAKAVLMSDPSRTKSFTIVIIYGFLESLAFYIHGENSTAWTWFGEHRRYGDILCHNDNLYVLPHKSYGGGCGVVLEVWNFDNNFPRKVTRIEPAVDEDDIGLEFGEVDGSYSQAYLMESMGEILCVKRVTCLLSDEDLIVEKRMHHFFVYKLDCCGKRFENVITLGDQVIFLGRNQSIAVSAQKFGEWKKDSIYFLVWKELACLMLEFDDFHPVEVYDLEEKALKPYRFTNMIQHIQEYDTMPFWIVPNPW